MTNPQRPARRGTPPEVQDFGDPRLSPVLLEQVRLEVTGHQGPLPPPEMLKEYEDVLPGAAERIVTMAEGQTEHRQSIEHKLVDSHISLRKKGQWFAFVIAMAGIVAGATLIALDKSVGGFVLLVGSLGTMIGMFLYRELRGPRDSEHPAGEQTPPGGQQGVNTST